MNGYYGYDQDEQLRQLQEQQRLEEEQRARQIEAQRQQMLARRSGQPQAAGGIDPGTAMQMMQQFGGSGPAAGGISGGGTAAGGTAATGTAAGGSAAAGGTAAGGSAAGGAGTSLMSFWPAALVVAGIAQHQWAKKKGLHSDRDALDSSALLKDSAYYQEQGNQKIDGLGDEIRLGALGSSPKDLFKKETWSEAAKLAARGGMLGRALKKIF